MIGEIITWTSSGKIKTGKIVGIVPADEDVEKFVEDNFDKKKYSFKSYGWGSPRKYYSFLVELLPNIPQKQWVKKQLYWPSMNEIKRSNPHLWKINP